MTALTCLHCGAGLSRQEAADGWCEACGKKLPPSMRAAAAGAGTSRDPRADVQHGGCWISSLGTVLMCASFLLGVLFVAFLLCHRSIPWPAHIDDATKSKVLGDFGYGLLMLAVSCGALGASLRRRA